MPRAIIYRRTGSPDVLELVEIEPPRPGPGQVCVRIEAAGVNPIDGKLRGGHRPTEEPFPRRSGYDGAGVVTDVGRGVEGLRVGEAVAFAHTLGAHATDVVADQDDVWPRPPSVSAAEAASLGSSTGTAYQVLRSMDVGPTDTLLVHGGSGSVGRAMIQFARLRGARVIATCSARRAGAVAALGADPVGYGEGLVDRVRSRGEVTVAVDCAGADGVNEASMELIADRDRIATIARSADARAWGIRSFGAGLTPRESRWRREAVPLALLLIAADAFHVELGPRFPLEEAAEAQRLCDAGADGKIILVP